MENVTGGEGVEERRRGVGFNWCRLVLWTLIVVLGGACVWIWWVLGKVSDAVQKQGGAPKPAPSPVQQLSTEGAQKPVGSAPAQQSSVDK